MSALFIGRFQPFHLGHLDAVKQALKKNERVFISIGSAAENFLPENPFTAGERIQMIEAALNEAKIPAEKYLIIPIANINNSALWPAYVDLFVPPFQTLYTGSPIVEHLYKNYNETRKNPYTIVRLKQNLDISSTRIRKKMLVNKNWEKDLPESVAALIKKWNGVRRIQTIQNKEQ